MPDPTCVVYDWTLASPYVIEKLTANMLREHGHAKAELLHLLQRVEEAAPVWKKVLQLHVHERLGRGCTLRLRAVSADGSSHELTIERSDPVDVYTEHTLTTSTAKRGPYHHPKAANWESIDSFYIPTRDAAASASVELSRKHEIVFFQVTVAKEHPVNASGLIHVLSKLGMLERIAEDPSRAALVFVVPQEIETSCMRQQLIRTGPSGDEPLTQVDGIGKVTAENLGKTYSIKTVSQLLAAITKRPTPDQMKDRWWNSAVRAWAKNGQPARDARYAAQMTKIPQFVCTLIA